MTDILRTRPPRGEGGPAAGVPGCRHRRRVRVGRSRQVQLPDVGETPVLRTELPAGELLDWDAVALPPPTPVRTLRAHVVDVGRLPARIVEEPWD